jgi:23S rRNA pseudouridine1911/1915/1917 synthase
MIKVSVSDIITVLRLFNYGDADTTQRQIDQIKRTMPDEQSTLVNFRFNKKRFYILLDHRADDDADYILNAIHTDLSEAKGELVENPKENIKTYGMPFKGKEVYLFEVDALQKRLDHELAFRFPETSRSTWQKYIKQGYVSVNGAVRDSPKFDVNVNDSISVTIPDATDFSASELPILYIDDNVIVVNKPAGVLTHSKGALNDEFTVADFFARYSTYHLDSGRAGIVHRLDRDTSGVIIGARNEETAVMLQKQFADRKVKKTYVAIVQGVPKNEQALIDLPIGRNPSAPSTFRVDSKGKAATTAYEVIEANDKTSLVVLSPRTGRTHQLRVHMAYVNTPIVGDRVYGKEGERLFLHAYKLEITIPISDRREFVAPVPSTFTNQFPNAKL